MNDLAGLLVKDGANKVCADLGRVIFSALEKHRDVFLSHIESHYCPTGECVTLSAAPCQLACPAIVDVPSYVALVGKGRYKEALEVLLNNPRLMLRARRLIESNTDAVAEVLDGNRGVIYNTDEIISFLDAYAQESPASLRLLAITVKKEMLEKQKQGETFLGFELH